MKKLFTLLLIALTATAALPSCAQQKNDKPFQRLFIGPTVKQQKPQKKPSYLWPWASPDKIDAKEAITRKINQQKIALYANNRVMRMCREWKGCEKWARGRYALDTSFRITDMEIIYYFGHPHQWKWSYELYVQTWESGRARTYKFYKQEGQEGSSSWEEIDAFPGHPLDGPAQHAKYPSKKEIYARWDDVLTEIISPQLDRLGRNLRWDHQMAEERVVVWEDGKPVWKRRLYMYFICHDDGNWNTITRRFVIEAKQDPAGDLYTYSNGKWKEYIF